MNISPCVVKLNTSEISMQKHVHITHTAIFPNHLFGLRYQQQVLELMHLGTVWIILPYRLTWADEPLNTALKTPLLKTKWLWHGANFLMSALQCIIVLR